MQSSAAPPVHDFTVSGTVKCLPVGTTGTSVKACVTNADAKGSLLASDEEEGGMPKGPRSLNSAKASSGSCAFGFRLVLLHIQLSCAGEGNSLSHVTSRL